MRALIGQPCSTLRAKPEVLAIDGGDNHGIVTLGSDCRGNFKIPGESYLGSCPHRPRAERLAALQTWIAERG